MNKVNNELLLKQFAKGKESTVSELGIQNCVIYTRVSSKEQMETNQSLEWQKKYCIEYATKNKLNIKGYFGGTYESAKSDERKEFNRMLKAVKASREKITYILVYSLDRFSRTGDSAIYIASQLKKIGINILAVTQPIDTNSHAGALQQNIQFIFSKYDNDLRRQKTIDGMREKLLRGEWIGTAPTGYYFVKGAPTQTIIHSDEAKFIKLAFEWRACGFTYEHIIRSLKELNFDMPKQTLSCILKNPFYCGYMSHNLLNGEVIKGKHPALISEEMFLRANELIKTSGFKSNKINDHLPLKTFVKDAETGIPFTGYLVKKKGLYYYKVNKASIKVNRSAKMMHQKLEELMAQYTIDEKYIEPLKLQLQYTWENLTEASTIEKQSMSAQLKQVEDDLYTLRKRHALGNVSLDVYQEFAIEIEGKKKAILENVEKLSQKLSNPQELIDYSLQISCNLYQFWDSGDYRHKQFVQKTLFPEGLAYDAKIEHYRTPKINSVIRYISDISRAWEKNKNRTSLNFEEKSGLVPSAGLEPACQ